MAVVFPLSLISTENNGNFNFYTYSRVLCILSFWLPSLHKFSFVRILLRVMNTYLQCWLPDTLKSWELLCMIALITMYYANTKVGTNIMKLATPSTYDILYIWSVFSISV